MPKLYRIIIFFWILIAGTGPAEAQTAKHYLEEGNRYFKAKQFPAAIAAYSQGLAIKPDLVQAYNNRGLCQTSLKNYVQALTDFNQAIKLAPRQADLYYNRGLAFAGQQKNAAAISDYSRALALHPDFGQAYFNRGLAYGLLENNKAAITDFKNTIRLNPKDGAAYFSLGMAQYNTGDRKNSCINWQKAHELGYTKAKVLLAVKCK